MPPHGSLRTVELNREEVNILGSREGDQLRLFSEYCRIFYINTISVGQKSNADIDIDLESSCSGGGMDDNRIEVSKAVLDAFNSICVSRRPLHYENEVYRAAVTQCGLSESFFSEDEKGTTRIGAYIKARDKERSRSHQLQMRARKFHFLSMLREKEEDYYSQLLSQEADFCTKMKRWEREGQLKDITREFVRSYKKKIGAHSFLAGFRKLFETQFHNRYCVVIWSFDFATLTENCSTGDDAIMHDALFLLLSLLSRKHEVDDGEEKKEEDVADSSIISWVVQDIISISLIRRILNVLPQQAKLDAKPTGKLYITNEQRIGGSGKNDADNWCIVL